MWKAVYVDNDEDAKAFDLWLTARSQNHIPSLDSDQEWEKVEEDRLPEVLPKQEKLF
jgi:hypothetical protein